MAEEDIKKTLNDNNENDQNDDNTMTLTTQ